MTRRALMGTALCTAAAIALGGLTSGQAQAQPNCEIPGKCGPGDWPIPPAMTIERPSDDDRLKPMVQIKTRIAPKSATLQIKR